MIQKIRSSRVSKIIACYLAIQMIISVVQPSSLYALTGGPSQPGRPAQDPSHVVLPAADGHGAQRGPHRFSADLRRLSGFAERGLKNAGRLREKRGGIQGEDDRERDRFRGLVLDRRHR